jgi:hypothetical protein
VICLKCLAKYPSQRYPSAADLAEDLGRWLRGEPIVARPTGSFERAWRWCRRNPALAALGAIACACVMALVGLGVWFSGRMGVVRAEQETAEARAEADRNRARAEQERAAAAERVAATQRFFVLFTQARQQSARAQPGWTWKALDDLAAAARLPAAADHQLELRNEAASCLGAVDVRLARTIPDVPRTNSIAWHPKGRRLALGDRAGGLLAPCLIHLVDLDGGTSSPRKLPVPQRASGRQPARPDIVTPWRSAPTVAGRRRDAAHAPPLGPGTDPPTAPRSGAPDTIERLVSLATARPFLLPHGQTP